MVVDNEIRIYEETFYLYLDYFRRIFLMWCIFISLNKQSFQCKSKNRVIDNLLVFIVKRQKHVTNLNINCSKLLFEVS